MARYRPDIKPPMWGPLDAVRYAALINSERMGIDPTGWEVISPIWEFSGQPKNIITGRDVPITGTHQWVYDGLFLASDSGDLNFSAEITPRAVNMHHIFTAVLVCRPPLRQPSAVEGLMGFGNGGAIEYTVAQSSSADNRYCPIQRGATNGTYTTLGSTPDTFVMHGTDTVDLGVGFILKGGQQLSTASISISSTTEWGVFTVGRQSYDLATYNAQIDSVQMVMFHRDNFTALQRELISATPYALLMPVSRPVYFDLGAGGGSYTETLDTLITSISSTTDRQAYRETVDTLIQSGATVDAVTGMVEALLTLGQAASTAADVQGYADGVSDTIISASDAADAQDYVDGPATTGVSSSDETDTQSYVDNLGDTLVSASSVTEATGTPPITESLLTTAVSASNVSAAQAYVDTVTALAGSASNLGEVLGLVEQIGTVGESVSAVSDRQLYYDNVAIVALSSSSLAEVGAYIEQVAAAAVSASSLTDVLVGSFVGRYVFADYCRPRSFADYARARSFEDYCRPRGRRLQ